MIYEVTKKQWEYMSLYYGCGMTMEQIGRKKGVNKATVSRTLQRGRERLYGYLASDKTTSFDNFGIVKGREIV